MTIEVLQHYGPCPDCGGWHDGSRPCTRCLGEAAITRCARCGHEENCRLFTVKKIALCPKCQDLVIAEWKIRVDDFAELSAS